MPELVVAAEESGGCGGIGGGRYSFSAACTFPLKEAICPNRPECGFSDGTRWRRRR